jgi:hypothetical protein
MPPSRNDRVKDAWRRVTGNVVARVYLHGMTATELMYEYRVSSLVRRAGERSELLLETSGGLTEAGPAAHPYLFRGFLTDPGPAALGMLACAAVARARYYTPASVITRILADPVVTSNGDRLRFESFSGCCGVHARLDLLPSALAEPPVTAGTTNVDFNEPMRAALTSVAHGAAGRALVQAGREPAAIRLRRAVRRPGDRLRYRRVDAGLGLRLDAGHRGCPARVGCRRS